MSKKKNKRVLFSGSNGFPFGSAVIQRQIQLANALVEAGYDVTVINNRGTHSKSITQRENISTIGKHGEVNYVYTSILPYKSDNFIVRNFFKLLGIVGEFFTIIYYVFFKKVKCIFNGSVDLSKLKYYFYISKTLRIKLIYDYVEMVSSINNRDIKNLELTENNFDNQFYKYIHKLIVISSFLDNYVQKVASDTLRIKIPPIIDFSYFDKIQPQNGTTPFFLFCGSAAYLDVIKFIIESYHKSNAIQEGYRLKLILNGKNDEMSLIHNYIKDKELQNGVEIVSNLSYSDLVSFYKSANALLIPIKNNLQDQARFPFKICEYVASKRPIITSDSGVIKEFFTDNVDAFIAETDNLDAFISKLNLVIKEPDLAEKVGTKGYMLGTDVFNYKTYAEDLTMLIQN